jgi:hypothetical protein
MRSITILRNKKVFNNQKIKTKMKRIIFALTVLMNTVILNAQNITLPSGSNTRAAAAGLGFSFGF